MKNPLQALRDMFCWENAFIPICLAVFPALYHASKFRWYMPLPEGYQTFQSWLVVLPMVDLAFHEGGHPIFGMLSGGNDLITAAGGTAMQLLIPTVCLFTFANQGSRAGVLFCFFWIGESLTQVAYYMADAKQMVIILITGMSGAEGGMHDFNTIFSTLHVLKYCVGIGQLTFFTGVFLFCFACAYPIGWALRQLGFLALAPGETRLMGS